jgi:hypothetical protein
MNESIIPTVSRKWSKAEWALRVQLAEFYRLVEYLGWSEMIFNHIPVGLLSRALLPRQSIWPILR